MSTNSSDADVDVTGGDAPSLQLRVKDLEAEVATLKQQLQAKDQELDAARKGMVKQPSEVKSEHMQHLQERLRVLKTEQSEANQTRETAWKHLRETVQDLAKLVNQNDLNPLQTSVTGPVSIWASKKDDVSATS